MERDNGLPPSGFVQKCREIDVPNRQALAAWEAANASWIDELNRWNGRVSIAESEIKRLERECVERRNASISKFQRRRLDAEGVLKSHEGVRQNFELELRQAEDNSKKTQLEEYLDNSLVRSAHLQGINSSRLHVLESFGIETAKDLSLLEDWKLPGIGFILSIVSLTGATNLHRRSGPSRVWRNRRRTGSPPVMPQSSCHLSRPSRLRLTTSKGSPWRTETTKRTW